MKPKNSRSWIRIFMTFIVCFASFLTLLKRSSCSPLERGILTISSSNDPSKDESEILLYNNSAPLKWTFLFFFSLSLSRSLQRYLWQLFAYLLLSVSLCVISKGKLFWPRCCRCRCCCCCQWGGRSRGYGYLARHMYCDNVVLRRRRRRRRTHEESCAKLAWLTKQVTSKRFLFHMRKFVL